MTEKKSVTDQVYERLFHQLVNGNYAPGDRIPTEMELASQYGVSRNTIRSALDRMNVLGIIETRRGDGSYLKNIGTDTYLNAFVPAIMTSVNDLMGLMTFRRGVEVSAARQAAINATEKDIRELDAYFDYIEKQELNNEEYAAATSSFHSRIAQASKNRILEQLLDMIRWITTSKMADFLTYKPDVNDSRYYHQMIYRCIKHHKPEEAAYMMDRHMAVLIERVEDYTRHIQAEQRHEYGKVVQVSRNKRSADD